MSSAVTIAPRALLARGILASLIPANQAGTFSAVPKNNTVTVWDSTNGVTASSTLMPRGGNFRRLVIPIFASHDLTVIVDGSVDGTNWSWSDSTSYAASTQIVINYHCRFPHQRVRVTEGANATLTSYQIAVFGDESSANPGV